MSVPPLEAGAVDGETNAAPARIVCLWIEQIEGEGEDAPPVIAVDPLMRYGYVAVFDGMGGASSIRYLWDGREQSGARIAALLAARAFLEHIGAAGAPETAESLRGEGEGGVALLPEAAHPDGAWIEPDRLADRLGALFCETAGRLVQASGPQRLKGRGLRRLATTMAAAAFVAGEDRFTVRSVWAGDSRCYFLSEERLVPLTTDDVKQENPVHPALSSDSPLSNCISETGPNRLHDDEREFRTPGLIICCSDGAYGFLRTPVHFEHMILSTLSCSETPEDWRRKLWERLKSEASDDVSMLLAPLGFPSFAALRARLTARLEAFERRYLAPIDEAHRRMEDQINGIRALYEQADDIERQRRIAQQQHDQQVRSLLDHYLAQSEPDEKDGL